MALTTVIFVAVAAAVVSCAGSEPPDHASTGEGGSTGEAGSTGEGSTESSAGLDAEPDCSFVTTFGDGTLRYESASDPFIAAFVGPRQELDLYPSRALARLAPLATGISTQDPGVYIFEYREDPPLVDGSFMGEGWFDRYSFRVGEEHDLWRLHQVGLLPDESWIVTEASAVEQVDPAAIATLARDCNLPIVQRRWECVYEVVTTAATVATCGEANAGVM